MRRPDFIAQQARRPSGWLGYAIGRVMALETAAANEAALDLLDLRPTDRVLEIGFGHGRTIARAAQRVPQGTVAGIDHAEVMLYSARRRCAALITSGQVQLECGDSARLPFPDAAFNKALAVHTLYFWQPPAPHLREIRRVLVAGGCLALAYRPAGTAGSKNFSSDVYSFYRPEHVHDLLVAAGFDRIETVTHSPELLFSLAHVETGELP